MVRQVFDFGMSFGLRATERNRIRSDLLHVSPAIVDSLGVADLIVGPLQAPLSCSPGTSAAEGAAVEGDEMVSSANDGLNAATWLL